MGLHIFSLFLFTFQKQCLNLTNVSRKQFFVLPMFYQPILTIYFSQLVFDAYYIGNDVVQRKNNRKSLLTFRKGYRNELIKTFIIFIHPISCCVCISLTSKPTNFSQKNVLSKSLRRTFFCVVLCCVVNLRKVFLNDVELLFVP